MSIKPDTWIEKMAAQGMITPFSTQQIREVDHNKIISYGLSSYGYDIRCASYFKIFTNVNGTIIDPKTLTEESLIPTQAEVCTIPPHSFALASSLERFKIPRDVLTICFGKSTYARCGVVVNVTPLEPEWEGYLTISISNTASLPVKIYAEEGIAQLLFLGAEEVCQTSYRDRKGKYQNQTDITLSKL